MIYNTILHYTILYISDYGVRTTSSAYVVYSIQCIACSILHTVYSIQHTFYAIYYILCTMHYILYPIYNILYN